MVSVFFNISGATPWHHNTFRYNISYNDGNTTAHGASVFGGTAARTAANSMIVSFIIIFYITARDMRLVLSPGNMKTVVSFFSIISLLQKTK